MKSVAELLHIFKGICGSSEYYEPIPSDLPLPPRCLRITSRIILAPYPTERHRADILNYLQAFKSKFMVWNLSEVPYADEFFGNQAIEHALPGFPCLGLQDTFIVCNSLRAWLDCHPRNIAIVHCQPGRARSHLVLACFFAWSCNRYSTCAGALAKVSATTGFTGLGALTPSQRRYMGYCDELLRCSKIDQRRLRLRRVVVNQLTVPDRDVCPMLQVLSVDDPPLQVVADATQETVLFDIGVDIANDVVFRYRHSHMGKKKTLFKCMLNTSFISGLSLTLDSQALDWKKEPNLRVTVQFIFDSNEVFVNPEVEECWDALACMRSGIQARNSYLEVNTEDSDEEDLPAKLVLE